MSHTKDRKGQHLKVGHRVLIPAHVVHLSSVPGQYNTKVLLDETAGFRDRTEITLNSGQVELHPDELEPAAHAAEPPPGGWPPAEEPKNPPTTTGEVQDSNVS